MTAPTTDIDPADLAWCQAFYVEAQRRDLCFYELWEIVPQLVRDPQLRSLPPAEAVEHWRIHG